MKYPKLHGKSLTKEQKAEFDKWRETFGWISTLEVERITKNSVPIQEIMDVIAWNCAYEVMADKYEK